MRQGLLDGEKVGFAEAFAGNFDLAIGLNEEERRHVFQAVRSRDLVGRVVNQDGERYPEGGGKSRAVRGLILYEPPDSNALFKQLLIHALEEREGELAGGAGNLEKGQ